MRRHDREITEGADILTILDKCRIIRIGLCDHGRAYIVPMNFAYETADGKLYIYLHCAHEGRKMDIISRNNKVCFEADRSHEKFEGDLPCSWTEKYESVMGEGEIEIVNRDTQKVRVLDVFMKRYGFAGKPQYSEAALAAVTILRVNVTAMTGKRNG